MAETPKVLIRAASADDVPFIFATWLKGLRYGNELFGLMDADTYFAKYHQVIQRILADPKTKVSVACLADDPGVILGYSVMYGATLHWVHVKTAWRRIGIAKQLVPHVSTVTHLTRLGIGILKNHPTVKFDPFAL